MSFFNPKCPSRSFNIFSTYQTLKYRHHLKKYFLQFYQTYEVCYTIHNKFRIENNQLLIKIILIKKDLQEAGLFSVCKFSKLRFSLEAK